MRVFVLGGTGAVGRCVVSALAAAGHEVTALARAPEKAERLRQQGASAITVSMFDEKALTDAFAGYQAVINVASALPEPWQFLSRRAWAQAHRLRTEGSAAVVNAALVACVDRVIQESVSMLYTDQGSDWITEDDPADNYPITAGNHAAEANARRFTERGGAGVILRFGVFYGPHATHSEQFLAAARMHIGVMLGKADTYISSIHVADAATSTVAALTTPPGTYNIVDNEPVTKKAYAQAVGAAVGKTPWVYAPGPAALLLGNRTTSLTRSLRVSNNRFRAQTDWQPTYDNVRTGYAASAEQHVHYGARHSPG
jgi:nucleoside-diphosphate-sugar epimerase